MHRVTVLRTIPQENVNAVLARDAENRLLLGVPLVKGKNAGGYAFIHIDRATALDLERGNVDLYTALTERGLGLRFEAVADDAATEAP